MSVVVPSFNADDPALLAKIRTVCLDRRIRGEDKNKTILFLICLSTFLPQGRQLHSVVKGASGGGKSNVVNRVLDIFRKMGVVIEFSRITGAYLENMAKKDSALRLPIRQLKEAGVTDQEIADLTARLLEKFPKIEDSTSPRTIDLTGKILFVDELRGIQNAQAPKLLISEGRLRLGTVINGEPVEIQVIGCPVIITTTTLAVLEDPEFENRVLPLQIDESENQTRAVLQHEALEYADPTQDPAATKLDEALINLLKQLQPYNVANPYAEKIAENYPTTNIEARRDFPKLMNLVTVVAWLYQKQRQHARKGLDIVVVADPWDITTVTELALQPLTESLTGVSLKEQPILDTLKESSETIRETLRDDQQHLVPVETRLYRSLTIKEIYQKTRKLVRRGEQWTRDRVNRLVEDGYLEEDPSVTQKPFKYRYSELQPGILKIPTPAFDNNTLSEWAAKHHYEILLRPSLENDRANILDRMAPSSVDKDISSPNFDFGIPSPPNTGSEDANILRDHLSFPSPETTSSSNSLNNGESLVVEAAHIMHHPPFIEPSPCAICRKTQPLRADRRGQFLVCQDCYDNRSVGS